MTGSTLLGAAVEASNSSFTLSSATAPDYPLTYVNAAFTATTGYSAAEAVGRNCRFLQGPRTDPEQLAALREALREGRHLTVVLLNYRKDGSTFWNQITVDPVHDAAGTITHYVGVQRDVSRAVDAQQALQHALRDERTARDSADTQRHRAELLAARAALMARVTGVLAATLDVTASLAALADLIVPEIADWVVINLVDEQGSLGAQSIARHRDGDDALLARYAALVPARLAAGTPLHALLAGGPPTVIGCRQTPPAPDPAGLPGPLDAIDAQLGVGSVAFVPLTAREQVVGTMMLAQAGSARVFDPDDLQLAADLGRRAGLAVDNARLYTRERTAAVTLQRSLLPALPTLPGIQLAAEYLPAALKNQVGGDWWDVFALPDGAIGLAIGDVMGHDIAAAAVMGQLRSVLRSCAWGGEEPAAVLERMNDVALGFDLASFATCFYARLQLASDQDPARLTWSNAGHLPPLLLAPDGSTTLLTSGRCTPIGVPTPGPWEQDSTLLAASSTLLLYTDGLVETRGGDIDVDIAALRARVEVHAPGQGPAALVAALLVDPPVLTDDITVLAVQLGTMPAGPAA